MTSTISPLYATIKRAGSWNIAAGVLELAAGFTVLNLLIGKHAISTTAIVINGALLLLSGAITVFCAYQLRRAASAKRTTGRRSFYILAGITGANFIIPIVLGNPLGFVFLIPGLPLYQADKALRELSKTTA